MSFDFGVYQTLAQRTAGKFESRTEGIAYAGLKLCGEAGEVADLIGKWIGQGHALDMDRLADEMGDVLWHLTDLATKCGFSLSGVAHRNLEKLERRYPDGFSTERSLNREEHAE